MRKMNKSDGKNNNQQVCWHGEMLENPEYFHEIHINTISAPSFTSPQQ